MPERDLIQTRGQGPQGTSRFLREPRMVSMPPASEMKEAAFQKLSEVRSDVLELVGTSAHLGGTGGPETGSDLPTDTQQVGGAVESWTIS